MPIDYLRSALASGEHEPLIRYVRLHLGDGNESVGAKEIEKAWVQALTLLIETPPTNRKFIEDAIGTQDAPTLAHLFFRLHFYFVAASGEWIHDGNL